MNGALELTATEPSEPVSFFGKLDFYANHMERVEKGSLETFPLDSATLSPPSHAGTLLSQGELKWFVVSDS